MINREGQIWAFNYVQKQLKQTAFFFVLRSDLYLCVHRVYTFYDTDESSPRLINVYEQNGRSWDSWDDIYRIA